MVGRIYHVGLVVSDLERSIHFYRDVLGLHFQDEIFMEGEATEKILAMPIVRLVWLISMAMIITKCHRLN